MVEDTAFSWPFSSDTAEAAGGLEGWAPERIVLSWQVAFEGGAPQASVSNVLYITAASGEWGGDVQEAAGHCTAQRSLAELSFGDELAADGATLGTLYSPPGGDVASLGDCGRLRVDGWEGAPAAWMAEGLFGTDGWLFGVGPTALFGQELGELGAYALGGFTRLGDEVVVTNAVFLIDSESNEALSVEGHSTLPDGLLIAPPWFAIPTR